VPRYAVILNEGKHDLLIPSHLFSYLAVVSRANLARDYVTVESSYPTTVLAEMASLEAEALDMYKALLLLTRKCFVPP
jgi:hypothetical protein